MEFFSFKDNTLVFNYNIAIDQEHQFRNSIEKARDNFINVEILDLSYCLDNHPVWEISFEIYFPNVEEIILSPNLKALKNCQFTRLKNLKTINLPDNIEILSDSLFAGCESLNEIKIPNSVKKISKFCFAGSGLKVIEIPSSVKIICSEAFGCPELEKLIFSEGLKILEPDSIASERIMDLQLPSSLEQIGHIYIPNGVLDLSLCDKITQLEGYLTATWIIMPPNLDNCKVWFKEDAVVFFGDQLTEIEASFKNGEVYFFSPKIKSFKKIESWYSTKMYFPKSSLSRYSKIKAIEGKKLMKIEELPVQFDFFWI